MASGALRAEGTAEKPVVFTSAAVTPAAGDWTGIVVLGTPDPRTKIARAKVAFAGGTSQISSFGCPSPGAPRRRALQRDVPEADGDGVPRAGSVPEVIASAP